MSHAANGSTRTRRRRDRNGASSRRVGGGEGGGVSKQHQHQHALRVGASSRSAHPNAIESPAGQGRPKRGVSASKRRVLFHQKAAGTSAASTRGATSYRGAPSVRFQSEPPASSSATSSPESTVSVSRSVLSNSSTDSLHHAAVRQGTSPAQAFAPRLAMLEEGQGDSLESLQGASSPAVRGTAVASGGKAFAASYASKRDVPPAKQYSRRSSSGGRSSVGSVASAGAPPLQAVPRQAAGDERAEVTGAAAARASRRARRAARRGPRGGFGTEGSHRQQHGGGSVDLARAASGKQWGSAAGSVHIV